MARHKRKRVELLDYHEGLSSNQVKIILREFKLDQFLDEFNEWMYGQTCPILDRKRYDHEAKKYVEYQLGGVYEYDLFRWIRNKKYSDKEALIWD